MTNTNTSLLELVATPTESWLRESVRSCRSRLVIASPYVNDALTALLSELPDAVRTTLVTKTDIREFAAGSSDLETLCTLAGRGVRVMSLTRLHAKVYVMDRSLALVTSANATRAGLHVNLELGVAIRETSVAGRIEREVLNGLGANTPPERATALGLLRLRKPVEALRSTAPAVRTPDTTDAFGNAPLRLRSDKKLLSSFTGWTRLTLDFILSLPNDEFTLREVYEGFTALAERRYPNNRHVPDKIRQQLQRLQHFGLLDFLGDGVYRRNVAR